MSIESLRKQILAKNDDILIEAEKLGVSALPMLTELFDHEDDDIRDLALGCLSVVEDDQVPALLIKALGDKDQDIQMHAMQILLARQLDSSHLPALIEHLNHPDSEVREEIPLLVGRLDDLDAVAPLSKQLDDEENKDVIRSIKLALARLGDDECKNEFVTFLAAEESDDRLHAIEDLEYINDKQLARNLLPLLDDQAEAYEIGDPDDHEYSRICDAVVCLVSDWYTRPFNFEVYDEQIYSEEEIEEAKSFLESLGE